MEEHTCNDACLELPDSCKRGTIASGLMKGRPKGGRPKGSSNKHAKQPSAIAKAFLSVGLDWRIDFAMAIKANKRERIKMWLRLLPYMITMSNQAKVSKRLKGRASKAGREALAKMEREYGN